MKKQFRPLAATLLLITATHCSQAQSASTMHLVNTFHLAGAGGWDYLAVEPGSDKLYLSHATQVNIINKTTGDSLGVIPNTTGVHGIAFVPALNKGYVSAGKLNALTIFDLKTYKVLGQLPVGQNPDAIMYDEFSKRIIVGDGRSNDVTVVDPATDKVTATINVGGKPEQIVSNGAGMIYVNVEDKNEIVAIDINKQQVIHHWSLKPGEAPSGLAIDVTTNRLFTACSDSKQLEVIDATNGTVIAKLPIGDGCDGVAFDAAGKCVYTSNGEGNITVVKENDKSHFTKVAILTTQKGARTITIDPATHKLYLPTADFDTANVTNGRPAVVPGTFRVLVFGM